MAVAAVAGFLPFAMAAPGFAADPVEPSISPASIEAVVFPGATFTVDKTVVTPEIPPSPDIYFLADTTGSMTSALDNVKANASAVLAAIDAVQPDAAYGAGDYKDFPFDPYAFNNAAPVADDDGAAALAAIGAWTADGGYDGSEAQLFALDQLATLGGWRATTTARIVVWFGDWPGHDPVCAAISGLSYDVTEASVTAKLVAEGVRVLAISTTTGPADGLDGDPKASADDYYATCGEPGGTPGQASRIAAATGGVHLTDVAPDDISDAILAGLASLPVEVSMQSTCEWPISTTFEPATTTVASGSSAAFVEHITVAADAPGGTYTCEDHVLIDGEVLEGVVETKTIKVPEGFVTGGGKILKGDSPGVGFSGNVGFLADFSIVGQWQVNDPVAPLAMHSTGFTSLQFMMADGEEAAPPDANANAAVFSGTARVKEGKAGKWADGCTFTAYVRDQGEPATAGDPDGFGIRIVCGSKTYTYGRAPLMTGNLQIHSGVKTIG